MDIEGLFTKSTESIEKQRMRAKERIGKSEHLQTLKKAERNIIDIALQINVPRNYFLVNTRDKLKKFVDCYRSYKETEKEPYTSLDTETYGVNPFKDQLISVSIGFKTGEFFNIPMRPFKHEMSKDVPTLDFDYVSDTLRPLLENDYDLILANAKNLAL